MSKRRAKQLYTHVMSSSPPLSLLYSSKTWILALGKTCFHPSAKTTRSEAARKRTSPRCPRHRALHYTLAPPQGSTSHGQSMLSAPCQPAPRPGQHSHLHTLHAASVLAVVFLCPSVMISAVDKNFICQSWRSLHFFLAYSHLNIIFRSMTAPFFFFTSFSNKKCFLPCLNGFSMLWNLEITLCILCFAAQLFSSSVFNRSLIGTLLDKQVTYCVVRTSDAKPPEADPGSSLASVNPCCFRKFLPLAFTLIIRYFRLHIQHLLTINFYIYTFWWKSKLSIDNKNLICAHWLTLCYEPAWK